MKHQKITHRIINSILSHCRDIGVDDLGAAERNRKRVAEGYATEWWEWFEARLKTLKRGERLPDNVDYGVPFQIIGEGEKRSKRWAETKGGD